MLQVAIGFQQQAAAESISCFKSGLANKPADNVRNFKYLHSAFIEHTNNKPIFKNISSASNKLAAYRPRRMRTTRNRKGLRIKRRVHLQTSFYGNFQSIIFPS